jgi:hypothetical protein
MPSTSRAVGVPLTAALIAVAAWLLYGWAAGWRYLGGPNEAGALGLAPYVGLGLLAVLAGRRANPAAAWLILLGGIIGAAAVAWVAGPVGVEAGADPNMRAGYFVSLVVIAGAISAVAGAFVVWAGYFLGRRSGR